MIASVFHPDLDTPEVREFVAAYRAARGEAPDTWAAQGYDALMLLAHAIHYSRNPVRTIRTCVQG